VTRKHRDGSHRAPSTTAASPPLPIRAADRYRGGFTGPWCGHPRAASRVGLEPRGRLAIRARLLGGGFLGSVCARCADGFTLFGSIVDNQNQVIYPSYQAEPDSPGAQLLQDYGLQQTDCGPPDLVVIWGPDNSVICAFPNDTVAPGNYDIDPSTFTLVSGSP